MMKCVNGHTEIAQAAIRKGELGEQIVTQALREKFSFQVIENTEGEDGKEEPGWDIIVLGQKIEIKSSAGVYNGKPAATSCLQGTKGSPRGPQPEDWRNRKYATDAVILFNLYTRVAYLYKAEMLRQWYEARLHREFEAHGAGKNVWCNLIEWEDREAGFIAKFDCSDV